MEQDGFTYRLMRDEWVAEVGYIDQYGNPRSFKPYWVSEPYATRAEAIKALESHEDVRGYDERLLRYVTAKAYTSAEVRFKRTEVMVLPPKSTEKKS